MVAYKKQAQIAFQAPLLNVAGFSIKSNIELQEILTNKTIVVIKNISNSPLLENTVGFNFLLSFYNYHSGTRFNVNDVMNSSFDFKRFKNFVHEKIFDRELVINQSEEYMFWKKFRNLEDRFKAKANQLHNYISDVYNKLYADEYSLLCPNVIAELRMFIDAYEAMYVAFKDKKREQLDPMTLEPIVSFEHIRKTMEIVLYEMKDFDIRTLVIALLHDSIEDCKGYNKSVLKYKYGQYIANCVDMLTKKDWRMYLTYDQRKWYNERQDMINNIKEWIELNNEWYSLLSNLAEDKDINRALEDEIRQLKKEVKKWFEIPAKKLRNKEYFGHLKELENVEYLSLLERDFLLVKCADRVQNLRSMAGLPLAKIDRKSDETEKYFLDPLKKHNRMAYKMVVSELEKVKHYMKKQQYIKK